MSLIHLSSSGHVAMGDSVEFCRETVPAFLRTSMDVSRFVSGHLRAILAMKETGNGGQT